VSASRDVFSVMYVFCGPFSPTTFSLMRWTISVGVSSFWFRRCDVMNRKHRPLYRAGEDPVRSRQRRIRPDRRHESSPDHLSRLIAVSFIRLFAMRRPSLGRLFPLEFAITVSVRCRGFAIVSLTPLGDPGQLCSSLPEGAGACTPKARFQPRRRALFSNELIERNDRGLISCVRQKHIRQLKHQCIIN